MYRYYDFIYMNHDELYREQKSQNEKKNQPDQV